MRSLDKTRTFVEYYGIKICYQRIPTFEAGHFFPKRLNKDVAFIDTIEDFERKFYLPSDEELLEIQHKLSE